MPWILLSNRLRLSVTGLIMSLIAIWRFSRSLLALTCNALMLSLGELEKGLVVASQGMRRQGLEGLGEALFGRLKDHLALFRRLTFLFDPHLELGKRRIALTDFGSHVGDDLVAQLELAPQSRHLGVPETLYLGFGSVRPVLGADAGSVLLALQDEGDHEADHKPTG